MKAINIEDNLSLSPLMKALRTIVNSEHTTCRYLLCPFLGVVQNAAKQNSIQGSHDKSLDIICGNILTQVIFDTAYVHELANSVKM